MFGPLYILYKPYTNSKVCLSFSLALEWCFCSLLDPRSDLKAKGFCSGELGELGF